MSFTTEDMLINQAQPTNLIARLDALAAAVEQLKNLDPPPAPLSTISSILGDIDDADIILGNENALGEGFSGLVISGSQFEWPVGSGQYWNLAGFNSDTLEVGIDALTGKLLAAGGAVTIGADAMQVVGLNYAIQHTATDSVTRTARLGMTEYDGSTIPHYEIRYGEAAGSNLLSNPGFEAGTLANWTTTTAHGTWSASTDHPQAGTYCAKYVDDNTAGSDTITSDEIAVTAGTIYQINGFWYPNGSNYIITSIEFRDSSHTYISNWYAWGYTIPNQWNEVATYATAPTGAAYAILKVLISTGYGAVLTTYLDSFNVAVAGLQTGIAMRPHTTVLGGALDFQFPATGYTPPTMVDGYSRLVPTARGFSYYTASLNDFMGPVTYNVYSSNNTWNAPAGIKACMIIAGGGGGGGGGGSNAGNTSNSPGGGGGGGGAVDWGFFTEGEVAGGLTITVGGYGPGGAGHAAGSSGDGATGTAGGTTTVANSSGNLLVAGGGAAGPGGIAGATGANGNGGAGGSARGVPAAGGAGIAEQGGAGGVAAGGNPGTMGGGGGGGTTGAGTAGPGGSPFHGGGGGGGGGAVSSGNVARAGGAGGRSGQYTNGGGGSGGAAGGSNGQGAESGSPNPPGHGGTGGGGGGGSTSSKGGDGGTGSAGGGSYVGGHYTFLAAGGGGGGGGAAHPNSNAGGDGGQGGRGAVLIIAW